MTYNKLISIQSVLFDLSTLMDEKQWNSAHFLEWATKGAKSLKIENKYVEKVELLTIEDHMTTAPVDLAYIVAAGIKDNCSVKPLLRSTSPYTLNCSFPTKCNSTNGRFSISEDGTIKTSEKEGTLILAYLSYPTDEEGYILIPDSEDVKESILNYVLWKYWTKKYLMKEEGSSERMEYHRKLWSTFAGRAYSVNLDIPTMENIKRMWNKMVSSDYAYDALFTTLNYEGTTVF